MTLHVQCIFVLVRFLFTPFIIRNWQELYPSQLLVFSKVVNTVSGRMYRTSIYISIEISTFRTGLNTVHTGYTSQFRTILAGTQCIARYKKKFFIFLSFLIFEFLLGQNGNLFALTYQYYLFSQYAMVTFKLSIFYIVFFSFFF